MAAPSEARAVEAFPEVVYDRPIRQSIQGNIVPGFNKDHQHFLFYRITEFLQTKKFLRAMSPSITSMDEALDFVRATASFD